METETVSINVYKSPSHIHGPYVHTFTGPCQSIFAHCSIKASLPIAVWPPGRGLSKKSTNKSIQKDTKNKSGDFE